MSCMSVLSRKRVQFCYVHLAAAKLLCITKGGMWDAQTRWRSKIARQELRRRRAEARESGKLLQDKQALEARLKEMQSILETVQNQRNELKQQFRASGPEPCFIAKIPRILSDYVCLFQSRTRIHLQG